MNYQQWFINTIQRLAQSDSPKRDAEILLGYLTGKPRSALLGFGETKLTVEEQASLEIIVQRRAQGEPIAYLIGEREFWSLPISVSPVTLIPRPDTECLVEQALKHIPRGASRVLDLGTGTGCIALALGHERSDCTIIGTDIKEETIKLASHNAKKLGLPHLSFFQGNWFSAVNGYFSVIVSNPPYIDAEDPHLNKGDLRYEPLSALVSADEGLADVKHIIRESPHYLRSCGWLLLEHGWQQSDKIQTLFYQTGFSSVSTYRDDGGHPRVTSGQWVPASLKAKNRK